jgi:hypothetical protein
MDVLLIVADSRTVVLLMHIILNQNPDVATLLCTLATSSDSLSTAPPGVT